MRFILLSLICFITFSCSQENDEVEKKTTGEKFMANFSFGGKTKAIVAADDNDLILMKIIDVAASTPDKQVVTGYGVFRGASKLQSIELEDGKSYIFETCVYHNRQELVYQENVGGQMQDVHHFSAGGSSTIFCDIYDNGSTKLDQWYTLAEAYNIMGYKMVAEIFDPYRRPYVPDRCSLSTLLSLDCFAGTETIEADAASPTISLCLGRMNTMHNLHIELPKKSDVEGEHTYNVGIFRKWFGVATLLEEVKLSPYDDRQAVDIPVTFTPIDIRNKIYGLVSDSYEYLVNISLENADGLTVLLDYHDHSQSNISLSIAHKHRMNHNIWLSRAEDKFYYDLAPVQTGFKLMHKGAEVKDGDQIPIKHYSWHYFTFEPIPEYAPWTMGSMGMGSGNNVDAEWHGEPICKDFRVKIKDPLSPDTGWITVRNLRTNARITLTFKPQL